jgi:superfamily I DNA and/or RNA helicase
LIPDARDLKDAIEDSVVLNGLLLQRRLSVGTVDSFQGQERDIIAISLTRSNPQSEIGFLSDIRRMNVGMTRARRKLLLVGDSSTLCSHPFFVDLLAYVKRIGGYFQSAGGIRTRSIKAKADAQKPSEL